MVKNKRIKIEYQKEIFYTLSKIKKLKEKSKKRRKIKFKHLWIRNRKIISTFKKQLHKKPIILWLTLSTEDLNDKNKKESRIGLYLKQFNLLFRFLHDPTYLTLLFPSEQTTLLLRKEEDNTVSIFLYEETKNNTTRFSYRISSFKLDRASLSVIIAILNEFKEISHFVFKKQENILPQETTKVKNKCDKKAATAI